MVVVAAAAVVVVAAGIDDAYGRKDGNTMSLVDGSGMTTKVTADGIPDGTAVERTDDDDGFGCMDLADDGTAVLAADGVCQRLPPGRRQTRHSPCTVEQPQLQPLQRPRLQFSFVCYACVDHRLVAYDHVCFAVAVVQMLPPQRLAVLPVARPVLFRMSRPYRSDL